MVLGLDVSRPNPASKFNCFLTGEGTLEGVFEEDFEAEDRVSLANSGFFVQTFFLLELLGLSDSSFSPKYGLFALIVL